MTVFSTVLRESDTKTIDSCFLNLIRRNTIDERWIKQEELNLGFKPIQEF